MGGDQSKGFDFKVIDSLTKQIGKLHDMGTELAIVLGGGNFFRGTKSIPIKMDRVVADHIGMMATLMNGLCLKEALTNVGKKSTVMTGLAAFSIVESFNKEKAVKGLKNGEILIFSGGTGNPFFSTDTAAVLRALEIEAEIVIKGTKVDGIYDKDPIKDNTAQKYDHISFDRILEKNLQVMDGAAIALCRENNLSLCVLSISNPSDLLEFLAGKAVGTMVTK